LKKIKTTTWSKEERLARAKMKEIGDRNSPHISSSRCLLHPPKTLRGSRKIKAKTGNFQDTKKEIPDRVVMREPGDRREYP
jgi:hypothetical protein